MRRLALVAALVICVHGPGQASLDNGIAAFQHRPHDNAAVRPLRLTQESLAVIVAPKRIDTDQETVDFTGRAIAPGEVTLTVDGSPVTVARDGSFRIRQQVPVGRSKLLLVVEGSYGDKAEQRVFVRRTAAPAQTTEYGAYHALVIGNDNYQHLTDLNMAVGDAHAIAALLTEVYGFNVETLIDATRYDIISAMSRKRAQLTENDNLFIYYAGHGSLDIGSDEGYWLPVDAEFDNPANWISNNSIAGQLRAMRAKHVMVVADSCYSGKLTRNVAAQLKTGAERSAWLNRMAARRSRTALTSGGLEPVLDAGGGGHSVFAKALLDALRANAQVLDGQGLFDAIKRPVVLNADQTPEYADIRKAGHDGGDFLFVPLMINVTVGVETPDPAAEAPAPIETEWSGNAAAALEQETVFWQTVKDSDDPASFEVYLAEYPIGKFAALARLKLKQLGGEEAERKAAEEVARKEAERKAAEEAARKEAARLAAEAEAKRLAEEEAARATAEADAERRVAEEAKRKAAAEAERKQAEREAAEAKRLAAEEAKHKEAERKAAEAQAAAAQRWARDRALWDTIKDSPHAADYQIYLQQFPNGTYAVLARVRLAEAERLAVEEAKRKETERKAQQDTQTALLAAPPEPSIVVNKDELENDSHLETVIKKYFEKQKFAIPQWGGITIEILDIEKLSVKSISGTRFIADIKYRYGDFGSGYSGIEYATSTIEKTANSYKVISFDRKR